MDCTKIGIYFRHWFGAHLPSGGPQRKTCIDILQISITVLKSASLRHTSTLIIVPTSVGKYSLVPAGITL